MKIKILILCFFGIFSTIIVSVAENKWETVNTKNGIKTYTRDIESSDMDEFMGETVIQSSIEVVGMVLLDSNNYSEWVADCTKSQLIKVLMNKTNKVPNINGVNHEVKSISYLVNDSPWPVSDRDIIIFSHIKIDEKKGKLTITSKGMKSNIVPLNEDYVRITDLKTTWIVNKLSDNKTNVVYIVKCNPGGNLSAGIANSSSSKLPYNYLNGLRKMTKKRKYIDEAKKLHK